MPPPKSVAAFRSNPDYLLLCFGLPETNPRAVAASGLERMTTVKNNGRRLGHSIHRQCDRYHIHPSPLPQRSLSAALGNRYAPNTPAVVQFVDFASERRAVSNAQKDRCMPSFPRATGVFSTRSPQALEGPMEPVDNFCNKCPLPNEIEHFFAIKAGAKCGRSFRRRNIIDAASV